MTEATTKTYSVNENIDNLVINVVQKVQEKLGTIDLNSVNTENTVSRSSDYARIFDIVFSELSSNEAELNNLANKLSKTFILNQPLSTLKALRENLDEVDEVINASS